MAETIPTKDRIGIITVLYCSQDVVEGFFSSLALQRDVNFKLYVIDNSPQIDTIELCKKLAIKHGIEADFVFNNANLGVARGNNQGIEMALNDGCSAVLLANNDTEFEVGTLKLLIEKWSGGAMIVTPKILYYGGERLIWFAGGSINKWTIRTPHRGQYEVDHGQYNTPEIITYAPTCFLLVDLSVFARIGYMDETYFVYYDDTDFIWRARNAGISIEYHPSAVILHKVSTSTGGAESDFTVYYTNRNRIYFIRKNLRGLHYLFAMTYVLTTRLLYVMLQPWIKSRSSWMGVWDGINLSLQERSDQ